MSAAMIPERTIVSRVYKSGWVRIDNPNYEAEVATSSAPWLVAQRLWTRELRSMDHDDSRPGMECWVYRPKLYAESTSRWVMMRAPRSGLSFFRTRAVGGWYDIEFDWKPAPEWSP